MLMEISGVEIFAAGQWNGDNFTIGDLNEMARAFNETCQDYKPFLKLGHNEEQDLLKNDGLPAAGYISGMRVEGDKLIADFSEIPQKVYELMKRGAYKKRSAEIYFGIDWNGTIYPFMIKAVSLLGAEMPAVRGLSDIFNLYAKNVSEKPTGNINIKQYSFQNTEKIKMDEALKELEVKLFAKEDEVKKFANENMELKAKLEQIEAEKYQAEVKAFTAELPPSIVELAEKLIEAKNFAEKKDLLKQILKLNSETSKVNFAESSKDEDESSSKNKEDALHEKIEAYAVENKVSYAAAYKALNRGE